MRKSFRVPSSVRRAAEHFGASNVETRTSASNSIGSFGSVNVVHAFSDANGVGAVYGSAASTADFFTDHFLDAAPDDVIGCVIHHELGLVVAAGRGNHKMFVHHLAQGETMASSSLSRTRSGK